MTSPKPRYDEVFFAGLAWLEESAFDDIDGLDSPVYCEVLPLCEHQEAAANLKPEAPLIDCRCRDEWPIQVKPEQPRGQMCDPTSDDTHFALCAGVGR